MISRFLALFRKPVQHVSHDFAYGHRPTPTFLARFEGLDAERERLIEAANLNASKRN